MHVRWKSYGKVLLSYLILALLVFIYVLLINWDYHQKSYGGFQQVFNDFGHFLSVMIIWLYFLIFIWLSSGIGFVYNWWKKKAYYFQIFGFIFLLSSLVLVIMILE